MTILDCILKSKLQNQLPTPQNYQSCILKGTTLLSIERKLGIGILMYAFPNNPIENAQVVINISLINSLAISLLFISPVNTLYELFSEFITSTVTTPTTMD